MYNCLYSIFDKIGKEFHPLFECRNDEVAKRRCQDAVSKGALNMSDYELYRVGSFDHETGRLEFVPFDQRKNLFVSPSLDNPVLTPGFKVVENNQEA